MFDIGFQELIIIFAVALVVVGPEKLPELSRRLGKWIAIVRRGINEAKSEIEGGMREIDPGGRSNPAPAPTVPNSAIATQEDTQRDHATIELKGEK